MQDFGENIGIKKMRTHLAYYTKGLKILPIKFNIFFI